MINGSLADACFELLRNWIEPGMGNVKANTFWEADLPQSYKRPSENDHVGLENFIRAKYDMLPPLLTPIVWLQANLLYATNNRNKSHVWSSIIYWSLEFSRHVKLVVLKPETCPLCIEVEKDLYQVKFIVWPWMCLDSRYEQLVAGSPLQAVS
jgi:hypothetical protein